MFDKINLDIWSSDYLKSLEEICVADVRNGSVSLEEHYQNISAVRLSENVFGEYKAKFETAKNIYLYSWFAYRMSNVALLEVFSVLEFVLRIAAEAQGFKVKDLSNLLEKANKEDWVNFETIVKELTFDEYREKIRNKRNSLSHGDLSLLMPEMVICYFHDAAEIINQLFEKELLVNKSKSVREGWC